MKIAIEMIKVDVSSRIRRETGDLQPLEESIKEVGLLNPIVINENRELIAGYRRLSACKNLGMTEIEVNIVDVAGDKIRQLDVELAENFHRKDFTSDEILASEKRRKEILESLNQKSVWEKCKTWAKNLFAFSSPNKKKAEAKKSPTGKPAAQEKTTEAVACTTNADDGNKNSTPGEERKLDLQESGRKGSVFQGQTSTADEQHAIKWRKP